MKTQEERRTVRQLSQSKAWQSLTDTKTNKTKDTKTTTKTLYDTIIFQDRINALLACDSNVLEYNPYSFLMIFRFRGRNANMILYPLIALLLWDVLWGLLLSTTFLKSIRDEFNEMDDLITPLLMPVSFLLVFRLSRAAVRFWDARSATGKLVEMCRCIISTAIVGCYSSSRGQKNEEEKAKLIIDDWARWICVFPIAVKNFVRPHKRTGWEELSRKKKKRFEIGLLLSDDDAEDVLNTQNGPILVLNRLRQLTFESEALLNSSSSSSSQEDHPNSTIKGSMLYQQLNKQIDILTGAWGATERINATPLPFVYVVHLRTFLMLYLLLWHFHAMMSYNRWMALLPLFAASWGLLGIEAAAVECERPFEWKSNHLAMGKMCVVVSQNVAQTMKDIVGQIEGEEEGLDCSSDIDGT